MSAAYRIILTGGAETPPNASTAAGAGYAVFDSVSSVLTYEVRVTGLDFGAFAGGADDTADPGDDVVDAHFHSGPSGAPGGVILGLRSDDDLTISPLGPGGTRTIIGGWETTDTPSLTPFLSTFAAAGLSLGDEIPVYLNLHSADFPGGEIRGQLVLVSTDASETITGFTTDDFFLPALGGDDIVNLLAGNDSADGGDGNDTVNGGAGNDLVAGGAGGDLLIGNVGFDSLFGGEGDDTLRGGSAGDVLVGGGGVDTATYNASTVRVIVDLLAETTAGGEAVGDTLTQIENLIGSAFNDILTGDGGANEFNGGDGADTLSGGGGDDVLLGAAGDDLFEGGAGADTLTGGGGIDTIRYVGSNAGVTIHLGTGLASGGDAAGDSFAQVENVTGSALADTLTGNAAANVLNGAAGADTLNGSGGADTLTGSTGADVFVFSTALGAGNVDTITDFSVPNDTINLENNIFTALAAGALDASAFGVVIVYNAATGALSYDADGADIGAAVQFATLAQGLSLTAADFVVI